MNRKHLAYLIALCCIVLFASNVHAQKSAILKGKVLLGKETVPHAVIVLQRGGEVVAGAVADEEGNFEIRHEPGEYTVHAQFGKQKFTKEKVKIDTGKATRIELKAPDIYLPPFHPKPGQFSPDIRENYTLANLEDIQLRGQRDLNDIAAATGAFDQSDMGQPLSFRGSGPHSQATFVDGVRVSGSRELPQASIDQVKVLTSGIPAEYGDFTGAIILVNTRSTIVNP